MEIESVIIRFAMEKAEELGCGYLVSGEYETTIAGSTWGKTLIKAKNPVLQNPKQANSTLIHSVVSIPIKVVDGTKIPMSTPNVLVSETL